MIFKNSTHTAGMLSPSTFALAPSLSHPTDQCCTPTCTWVNLKYKTQLPTACSPFHPTLTSSHPPNTAIFKEVFSKYAGSAMVLTKAPETIMIIVGGDCAPSFLFDSHPRPLFRKAHLLRFDTVGEMCRDLVARFCYSDTQGADEMSSMINMWEAQEFRLSEDNAADHLPSPAAHHPSRSIEWRRSPGGFSMSDPSRTGWKLIEADLDAFCDLWRDHEGELVSINKNRDVTLGEDGRSSFRMSLDTGYTSMIDWPNQSDPGTPTSWISLCVVSGSSKEVSHILSTVSFASDGSIDTLEWDCNARYLTAEVWKWHRERDSSGDEGHGLVCTTLDEMCGPSLDEVVVQRLTCDEASVLVDADPRPKQCGWRAALWHCIRKCYKPVGGDMELINQAHGKAQDEGGKRHPVVRRFGTGVSVRKGLREVSSDMDQRSVVG